jgi:D-alanyl-lipoteichoic acid acyltransferase DltB (MBOAT superfamily)
MLFNSYEFIFLFLPVTFLVYFIFARKGQELAIAWLVLASLFFYGWWNPSYLILIVTSMLTNFRIGEALARAHKNNSTRQAKLLLALGVTLNLAVLGYFKYAGFFVANVNTITGSNFQLPDIVLPLAISFFTFQQIAYLADAYSGITKEYRLSHYALFVTFFPQLIAGPIVHHKEMLPQFAHKANLKANISNISIGATIFFIGLFKKAVLADGVARYANPIFDSAAAGEQLTFFDAWGGALAYTMQLYFDFSGYSDMAIGAARIFGIRLPLNFHSPYKATSIIEFWRRWHITLSRFLRDYLYIPLGGSRKGKARRYINLMTTMLLGGLWHGAGWTFVIWGALHGFYLVINHTWHRIRSMSGLLPDRHESSFGKFIAWLITFLAVIVGWVFFRATSLESAISLLQGMAGVNGIALPSAILSKLGGAGEWLRNAGVETYLGGGSDFVFTYAWIAALLIVALLAPNTQQILSRFQPALAPYATNEHYQICGMSWIAPLLLWEPTVKWATVTGIIAATGILALTSISEFLYFQF